MVAVWVLAAQMQHGDEPGRVLGATGHAQRVDLVEARAVELVVVGHGRPELACQCGHCVDAANLGEGVAQVSLA